MSAGTRIPGTPVPMHRWPLTTGVTLAGDAWGNPSGPLVLLQHGGGQTRHAWKNVGETLGQAGYYAIAFDARGHGDSEWAPDGVYGQDAMVEDLCALLEVLDCSNPILVGASMGGGTSLVACGEQRVLAASLVLVDIAPKLEPEGVQKIGDFMRHRPDGYDSLEEVAIAIGNYQPHRKPPKDLAGLAKNLRVDKNGKYRWHWDPKFLVGPRDLAKRSARLEACAHDLQIPVLLVRGGLSDVLSEAGAKAFTDVCPHSEYVNITDAGHMVAGDRNDVFGAAVIEFLLRTVALDGNGSARRESGTPHHEGPPGDVNDVP